MRTPPRRRPPAQQTMLGLVTGYFTSQLVFVAARLGIADALAKGPQTPAALAKQVGADETALRRALRALASVGVFAETATGRFRLNPLGATLCSGRPGSLRDFAAMIVDDYNWQAWGALLHGVTTGERPFDHVHGMPAFAFLQEHPEKQRLFAASMASLSGTENAAVARAFPFGRLGRLVDVGGAHGHLLGTILGRYRRLRGVLFDQPQMVAGAGESGHLGAPGIAERVEIVGGDFFAAVPEGADAYVLKYIIHDWADDLAARVLRNCRDAMAVGGRVLVVEHVIPPGNGGDFAKLLDINMLVIPGGLERTKEQFRALLARAGLRLRRVIPTACPLSILETEAA